MLLHAPNTSQSLPDLIDELNIFELNCESDVVDTRLSVNIIVCEVTPPVSPDIRVVFAMFIKHNQSARGVS